jgi:hypothetical protein
MVENENIDDNDSMMLVMEKYEVYVDVANRDQVDDVAVLDDAFAVDTYACYVHVDDDNVTVTEHVVVVVVVVAAAAAAAVVVVVETTMVVVVKALVDNET